MRILLTSTDNGRGLCKLACVTTGIVMLGAISGAAQAATDTIYKYATPKTGAFAIHSMAMTPDRSPSVNYTNFANGLISSLQACYTTGVTLPQGAKIAKVLVYYTSGATGNVSASLYRRQLSNGTNAQIATVFFSDNSGTPQAGNVPLDNTPPSNLVVNNNLFAYAFSMCEGTSEVFFGARVVYTYDNAGD